MSLLAAFHQRVIARILYSAVLLATSLRTSGLGDVAGEVLLGLDLFLVRPCGKTPSIVASALGMPAKVDGAVHFGVWRG